MRRACEWVTGSLPGGSHRQLPKVATGAALDVVLVVDMRTAAASETSTRLPTRFVTVHRVDSYNFQRSMCSSDPPLHLGG